MTEQEYYWYLGDGAKYIEYLLGGVIGLVIVFLPAMIRAVLGQRWRELP